MHISSTVADYLMNLPQRLLRWVTAPLPHAAQTALAAGLTRLIVRSVPSLRRRADDNLRRVFPELEPADRAEMISKMAGNFGRTFIEIFHSPGMLARHRDSVLAGPGFEALRAAHLAGRPAILVSGHFGNWEAVRAYMKGRGMPCAGLYRAQNNPFFDHDFLPRIRFTGSPIFPKTRPGMLGFVRHIARGGFAAILLDQRAEGGAVLDFLGHPALTSTFIAEVALKQNALVVPAYGIRHADGTGMTILLEAPVEADTPEALTQALNHSLASQVRAHPEQYYWLHRRWAGIPAARA